MLKHESLLGAVAVLDPAGSGATEAGVVRENDTDLPHLAGLLLHNAPPDLQRPWADAEAAREPFQVRGSGGVEGESIYVKDAEALDQVPTRVLSIQNAGGHNDPR
eukprot:6877474-Lingulodinium_polyedra.AAC.1